MTRNEWTKCDDPSPMLEFLRTSGNDRKLLLFAIACCRRIWPHIDRPSARQLVELCEQYCDGLVGRPDLEATGWQVGELLEHSGCRFLANKEAWLNPANGDDSLIGFIGLLDTLVSLGLTGDITAGDMAIAAVWSLVFFPLCTAEAARTVKGVANLGSWQGDFSFWDALIRSEKEFQCRLIRDLLGNPFRKVRVKKSWFVPEVVTLAQSIYEKRTFEDISKLGDALDAAGCDNAEILAHCRAGSQHVRGCWVVDLLLGKEQFTGDEK